MKAIAVVSLLVLALTVHGAELPSLEQAQGYLTSREWRAASEAFGAIARAEPENGQAWQGLGRARHQLGEFDAALEAYARARESGFQPGVGMLLSAKTCAVQGKAEAAVGWLRKMVAAGVKPYQAVSSMAELRPLASREDFKTVLASMRPCSAPEYRQFDFWVGTWDVRSASGAGAVNRISLLHNDCILREDYVAGAYTGTSLSFFDASSGHWHQTWIDNQGNPLFLDGGFEGGKMVLRSAAESKPVHRITWTPLPSGEVRQRWESSTDNEATWTVAFDGIYSRQEENRE